MFFANAYLIIKDYGFKKFLIAVYYRFLILLFHLVPLRRYLKRRIYDYNMYLDVKDLGISRSLLLFAERELDHKLMLEEIIKPGMNIFDIGSNIGYYVLMEKLLLRGSGSVTAIEPSPTNLTLLKKNLRLNKITDVAIYNLAISDKVGKKDFFLARQSNLNTFHKQGAGKTEFSGKKISVDTSTVPDFSTQINVKPDLIRMDVEGHELEIIEAILANIKTTDIKPSIIFETHIKRYTGERDFSRILRQLFANGYKTRLISSSAEKGSIIIDDLGYESYKSVHSDNVVRKLYRDIKNDDAISLVCHTGGVRTVYLEHSVQ